MHAKLPTTSTTDSKGVERHQAASRARDHTRQPTRRLAETPLRGTEEMWNRARVAAVSALILAGFDFSLDAANGAQCDAYQQCGGEGFSGCTDGCIEWTECVPSDRFYSQCRPRVDESCATAVFAQCGGESSFGSGTACCPIGTACITHNRSYRQCLPPTRESGSEEAATQAPTGTGKAPPTATISTGVPTVEAATETANVPTTSSANANTTSADKLSPAAKKLWGAAGLVVLGAAVAIGVKRHRRKKSVEDVFVPRRTAPSV